VSGEKAYFKKKEELLGTHREFVGSLSPRRSLQLLRVSTVKEDRGKIYDYIFGYLE
jgi:hypothetical protein